MSKIRTTAKGIFQQLEKKEASPLSWINEGRNVENDQRSKRCKYFDTHGFIKVDGFAGECAMYSCLGCGSIFGLGPYG